MKRVTQLDGVRGIAILLVIVWHYFNCQIGTLSSRIIGRIALMSSLSWSGVDLFFVLSGFLIAGILLDHRETSNFFRVFYLRRVCRIFPLYFLLFGAFLCLIATPMASSASFRWLFHDPLPLWSYATFTQNIFMGLRGDFGAYWLGITWSLAVEEQFYLVVPLLIYLLPRRALVCVLVLAIVAAPLLRWVSPGFHALVNTPWRGDSLLAGALLAVLVRWHSFVSLTRRHRHFLSVLFIALLAVAAVMTVRPTLFGAFSHFWLAALYSTFILIAFVGSVPVLTGLLQLRWLVWCGQLSYGIYMFHQPVSGLLHGAFRQRGPEIHTIADAGITVTALGVTLLLATISFYVLERPILRFGHRFQYLPKNKEHLAPQVAPSQAWP